MTIIKKINEAVERPSVLRLEVLRDEAAVVGNNRPRYSHQKHRFAMMKYDQSEGPYKYAQHPAPNNEKSVRFHLSLGWFTSAKVQEFSNLAIFERKIYAQHSQLAVT